MLAALFSVQSVWILSRNVEKQVEKSKRHFAAKEGDIITLLNGANFLFISCSFSSLFSPLFSVGQALNSSVFRFVETIR